MPYKTLTIRILSSAIRHLLNCARALCGLDKYKGVASVPDRIKMFKRDMNYVQGLMSKEEEKAYLDDEMKLAYKLFAKDKEEEGKA